MVLTGLDKQSGVPHYLGSPDDLKLLLMKVVNRKTPGILTQRMVNKSWHSPLAALTSCLNMLGGDMMSPVVRAEKAAEAEGSAPIDRKACTPW
jgi:hypothetical protein